MITCFLQPASLTEVKLFGARMAWRWREHPGAGIEWEGRRRKCAQPGAGSVCAPGAVSGSESLSCASLPRAHIQIPLLTWSVSGPFVNLVSFRSICYFLAAFCAYFVCVCALFLSASKTGLWVLCYLQSYLLAWRWLSQTLGWPVMAVAMYQQNG